MTQWDDDGYDEESTSSSVLSHSGTVMGFGFWSLVVMLSVWFILALYQSVFGKSKTAEEMTREYLRDTNAEEGTSETVVSKLSNTVGSIFSFATGGIQGSKAIEQEKIYNIGLSCIPFNAPEARMAAGMAFDEVSGAVFLYGGFDEDTFRSDFHFYNSGTYDWAEVPAEIGGTPGKRVHVRFECVGQVLVMFGGSTEGTTCSDDLFALDTRVEPLEWIKIEGADGAKSDAMASKPTPKGRYGHAMCSYKNKLVVFGGFGENDTYLNDMWILDVNELLKGNLDWIYVNPGGDYWPRGRDSHCITTVGDLLVLFGGYDGVSQRIIPKGEIEIYDFTKKEWRCEVVCGPEPTPGAGNAIHTLGDTQKVVVITSNSAGIFNQMDVLDLKQKPMTWSRVKFDWHGDWTMIPGQRDFFSSVFDSTEGRMYVFGGRGGGDEGILHNTLICANFADHMDFPEPEIDEDQENAYEEKEEGELSNNDPQRMDMKQARHVLPGADRMFKSKNA